MHLSIETPQQFTVHTILSKARPGAAVSLNEQWYFLLTALELRSRQNMHDDAGILQPT